MQKFQLQLDLPNTGLHAQHQQILDREHDDQAPFSNHKQIDIIVSNIKLYVTLLLEDLIPTSEIEEFKGRLIQQINILDSEELHTRNLQKFQVELTEEHHQKERDKNQGWKGYEHIQQFGHILRQLINLRSNTEDEDDFVKTSRIIQGFLKQMQIIIQEDTYTVSRLQNYDAYANNIEKSCISNDREVLQLQPTHYWKQQKIIFKTELSPDVFTWVDPPLHRVYLSEVTKVYHEIVPFKIKHICLNNLQEPKIDVSNYFKQDLEPEKSLIIYCKPGTNIMFSYRLDDICKVLTIQKQYQTQRQLPISWNFSPYIKTVITPDGRIMAINCKATSSRIDSSMYQITDQKLSNKGRRLDPKYDSAFIYANKSLYVIGGNNSNQNCSRKNYRYSLRDKKWAQIADANVALRKPTVCVFRERYLVKIGGLNQFDYINKVIQVYDTQTDKWSIVRSTPKNVLQQVQILENSLAAQIAEDQIYIFGGKNANNYQKDTGFVLQIMQMREKAKKPTKISAQLWNVSIGKKNIYSFFGLFSQANVIVHNNCLYTMRTEACQSLPS